MSTLKLLNLRKNQFVGMIALLLLIGTKSIAQYDPGLYKRLITDQKKASTAEQQLESALALANYHTELVLLKGYEKSFDSAYYYLKKADNSVKVLKSETGKAQTALSYSRILELSLEYEKSIAYANKAIAILEKQSDKKLLALAYKALYNSYRYTNPLDKVILLGEKVVKVSLESKDDAIIGKAYENLAESYSLMRDHDKTMELLDKALHHYQKGGVYDLRTLYIFYGMMHLGATNYPDALSANLKAVEIMEKYKIDDFYNMTIFMNVGNMYRDMARFDTAIKYYEKGYAMLDRYDFARNRVFFNRQITSANIKRKNFAQAEKYLQISEDWYDKVDDAYKDFVVMSVLESYPDIGKPHRADRYVADAIKYLDAEGQKKATYGPLSYALAKYYYATKRYADAKMRAQNAVDNLSKTAGRFKLYEPYKLLYKIDSLEGNFASAMKNYNLANVCKDSMTSIAKTYQFAELEVKYDIDKKNKDNLLLLKQGELQKATLSKTQIIKNISLAGIILLAAVVFLIYRKFRITQKLRKLLAVKNQELEEILEDKDVLLNEKEWLLKEIHHRVKNNLQIVMSLLNSQSYFLNDEVAKKAIENSQHRIHSMSLIHKKLYQSENISTINMAVYFWELMEYYKVAFDTGGRIHFQLDVDPIELQSSQAVPVGLILNETVNNALKHAFPDNRQGIVKVSLKCVQPNKVELRVSDNGIGYLGPTSDVSTSLGMKLIHGFSKDLLADLTFNSKNGLEIILRFAVNNTIVEQRQLGGNVA